MMKSLVVLAFAGVLAYSVPALAQDAGQPGATGTGGSLTGSNTGTGAPEAMSSGHHMMRHHHRHHRRHHHHM
jgi:hypothetical protein